MRLSPERRHGTRRRRAAPRTGDVAPLLARGAHKGTDDRRLVVAPVDSRDRVLKLTCLTPGRVGGAAPRLADVFRPLLVVGAVRFYVGRPETPGAPGPSHHDFDLARRLADLGAALGVELSDLLILGAGGAYHSLREHGQGVAAWRDEARQRAIRLDPALARRVERVRAARTRRRPSPSLTRADSLRAALWACAACHRRQAQRAPLCRYCGAARTVH
jgi:hypothetical protein